MEMQNLRWFCAGVTLGRAMTRQHKLSMNAVQIEDILTSDSSDDRSSTRRISISGVCVGDRAWIWSVCAYSRSIQSGCWAYAYHESNRGQDGDWPHPRRRGCRMLHELSSYWTHAEDLHRVEQVSRGWRCAGAVFGISTDLCCCGVFETVNKWDELKCEVCALISG